MRQNSKSINVKTDIEVEIEEVQPTAPATEQNMDAEMADQDDDEESDEEVESVGFELNQRLIQAAAMREQGVSVVMDPEWEQFLKEAQERGEMDIHTAAAPRSLIPAVSSNPSVGPAAPA